MKKRLIALLLVLALLVPAGIASAATWYRVNTSSLKVRFLPSESAKVLGSYRRDYALTIGSSKDGWSYVTFSNGFQGYVQTKYLSKASSYSAWVYGDNTALRRGPDGNFASIASLAKGTKVTVLSHGSKYDYVNAGAFGNGYIVNCRLSRKKVAASGNKSTSNTVTGGGYDAWVLNAGNRTVNLRTAASTTAPIIASYATGTKVRVLSHGAVWDQIQVDGNTGWMMTRFLNTNEPAPTPTPDPNNGGGTNTNTSYTAYVVSANGKPVNVRSGKGKGYSVRFTVPYGASVTVTEHGTKYDHITYGGKGSGWIDNSFLQLTKPANAPDITTPPEPTPFSRYTTTITTPDGKSVNYHSGKGDGYSNVNGMRLSVGSIVTVLEISGKWAHIEYQDTDGWIWKEFLK